MTRIKYAAKAWISGVGGAITAYVGTWTDDPRILGIPVILTALATYLVPNGPKPGALPPPEHDGGEPHVAPPPAGSAI